MEFKEKLLAELPEVNYESALTYCIDDDMYQEILDAYIEADMRQKLAEAFADENVADYGVYAHGVKSTSRTIGLEAFADTAYELELLAKAGDFAGIQEKHGAFMNAYGSVLDRIKKVLS